MGGAFCLCAMAVPAGAVRRGGRARSTPTRRSRTTTPATTRFNMWFVLATETPEAIAATADAIDAETGLAGAAPAQARGVLHRLPGGGMTLDATDRRIVEATQAGLPLTRAALCGGRRGARASSEAEVIDRLAAMQARGVVRRIAAAPEPLRARDDRERHDRLGPRRRPRLRARGAGRRARLRQPRLPAPARAAGLALQPLRHGARPRPRRGRGQARRDRGAARAGLPRATTSSTPPAS